MVTFKKDLIPTGSLMSRMCDVGRLDNVFNEEYVFVPHYTMEPRYLDFSVKWNFWD